MHYDQLFMKTNNPKTKTKALKTFYNGTEILLIQPLLAINCLISEFKPKTGFFNNFLHLEHDFGKQ